MNLSDKEKVYLVTTIRKYFPQKEYSLTLFGSYASEFEESDFPKKIDLIDYHRVADNFKQVIDKTGIPL